MTVARLLILTDSSLSAQPQAAEELESHAVREAGERAHRWQELVNRAAIVGPMGEDRLVLPHAPAVQVRGSTCSCAAYPG